MVLIYKFENGQITMVCITGHAFEIMFRNLLLQVVIFMFRSGGGYAAPAGHTRIYWDVTYTHRAPLVT